MFTPKPYSIPFQPTTVAIQGQLGSFSHAACSAVFNEVANQNVHCFDTFDEAFASVAEDRSAAAMIPVDNTIAGKVPYVLNLIRQKGLYIAGEYFLPIEHCLVTLPDVNLLDVRTIHSHMHALAQCRGYLSRHRDQFQTSTHADTAGAAKMVSELKDPTQAAISPALAAHLYGLHINQRGIQDNKSNITRFLALSTNPIEHERERRKHYITTLLVKPKRSVQFPLHEIAKTLKDQGVHHCAMEEYTGKDFRNEGFYVEMLGHSRDNTIKNTLTALRAVASEVKAIGSYPTHHFQRFPKRAASDPTPHI